MEREESSAPEAVVRMREYGRRVRAGLHAQQVHDRIAQGLKDSGRVRLDFADVESVGATFLDRSLGTLVARHGSAVLRSIAFAHCTEAVEASILQALKHVGPLSPPLGLSGPRNPPDLS